MNELLEQMRLLRVDREHINAQLNKNTIRMRLAVAEAIANGMKAPTIARELGVTKRTVYIWSR